jgi:HJR/Mrr/RecB family endonuclease
VGNGAVQEAYAGMAFYRCDTCMVITNSEFTPKAVELAGRIGCVLIDGSRIPKLIEGRMRF